MRIAFLTYNLNITDGSGRFSHDLFESLRKESVAVTIIAAENRQPLFNFFKIRKIFKDSDIIHAIDIWPNGFYARLISFGLKKPIVITALGTYSVAPFYLHTKNFGVGVYSWRRFIMKWVSNGVQIVAISDYTKEKILEIMPSVDIKVIYPGFDLDFWSGGTIKDTIEVQPRYEKLKPYILSVGALKPRKGYHNSIRAFGIVAKKFENLNYIIIGQSEESDYARKLKDIVKENKLEKRVFFVSNGIDDARLLGFYRNAELFVLTPVEENNHFEGFGIVYLEAAASNLPIIAAYKSGATSAVLGGYNGLLVDQNDLESTANAILKILENTEFKTELSNNSREWVKNFSWEKIIKQYIEIYNAK